MRRLIPVIVLVVAFAGCQFPQWRVGQAKVPEPMDRPKAQVEAERQAADLVARTIKEPEEMIPVAQKLSESLGAPQKQIDATDLNKARDEALALLLRGMLRQQKQLDELNTKLAKYQGKEIEGTGFNLFGPSMSLVVISLIALGVICPPAATLMFFLLRKTRDALKTTITNVEKFSEAEPEAAAKLKDLQSKAMDSVHKKLVRKLKVSI